MYHPARHRAKAAAAAALLVFASCVPALARDFPSVLLQQPKAFWREVMKNYYGPYDRSLKCWVSERAGQRYCMRPHRLDQVTIQGGRLAFVVVGGSRIGEGGALEQSHADAGVLGLIILKDAGGQLQVVGKNSLYEDFGSFGQIPAEDQFEVHQIGPNDTYGWTAVGGWSGQGINIASTTVYAAIGDKVTSIGTLPSHYDEQGNCDNGKSLQSGAPCTDYTFDLLFDAQDQGQRFYPLILRLSGSREGVEYDQSFTVYFDPQKFRYEEIRGLPEGINDDG